MGGVNGEKSPKPSSSRAIQRRPITLALVPSRAMLVLGSHRSSNGNNREHRAACSTDSGRFSTAPPPQTAPERGSGPRGAARHAQQGIRTGLHPRASAARYVLLSRAWPETRGPGGPGTAPEGRGGPVSEAGVVAAAGGPTPHAVRPETHAATPLEWRPRVGVRRGAVARAARPRSTTPSPGGINHPITPRHVAGGRAHADSIREGSAASARLYPPPRPPQPGKGGRATREGRLLAVSGWPALDMWPLLMACLIGLASRRPRRRRRQVWAAMVLLASLPGASGMREPGHRQRRGPQLAVDRGPSRDGANWTRGMDGRGCGAADRTSGDGRDGDGAGGAGGGRGGHGDDWNGGGGGQCGAWWAARAAAAVMTARQKRAMNAAMVNVLLLETAVTAQRAWGQDVTWRLGQPGGRSGWIRMMEDAVEAVRRWLGVGRDEGGWPTSTLRREWTVQVGVSGETRAVQAPRAGGWEVVTASCAALVRWSGVTPGPGLHYMVRRDERWWSVAALDAVPSGTAVLAVPRLHAAGAAVAEESRGGGAGGSGAEAGTETRGRAVQARTADGQQDGDELRRAMWAEVREARRAAHEADASAGGA